MTVTQGRSGTAEHGAKPQFVFFHSRSSGRCRRAEASLAQVLQRRRNHATFDVVRVCVDDHPELAARFRVERLPTFLVVQDGRVARRIAVPRGCHDLESRLRPWLR